MIHNGKSRKLPFNPEEALAHLRASDPKLGSLIDRVGEFKLQLDAAPSPFESLLESILYQQLHGKAAASIHRRLREFFGDPTPKQLLDTPDAPLRAAGVSGNKIKAMRDLAAKTIDGTVPTHKAILKMPDADIVERLTEVRGIGPWTVEMLLIFRLGRPDVLPVTDYGVRKGFALTFQRLPKSRPIEASDLPKPDVVFKRGPKMGAVSLRRKLVSLARLRPCEGNSCGGTIRREVSSICDDLEVPYSRPEAHLSSSRPTIIRRYLRYFHKSMALTKRFICIHGHFYQPPRENPWLETVETQDSAAPYHDWNERVCAECYATNGAARTVNNKNEIIRIVNNYSRMSFNFGPTLLSWLKENAPRTYRMILDGERRSRKQLQWAQLGDGAGLQPHHHAARQHRATASRRFAGASPTTRATTGGARGHVARRDRRRY